MSSKITDKIAKGREYRDLVLTAESGEDNEYKVVGYATTFNTRYKLYEDKDYRVEEQVNDTALNNCDMSDVIFQYNHEGRVFARQSNNTLTLEVDEKGLRVEAYLGGTVEGRNLYNEIRGGYITKMSFGFTVREDNVVEESPNIYVRTITDISKIFDVSAVSIPANDATEITARAFTDGVIEKAVQERNKAVEHENKVKQLKLKINLIKEM